MTAAGNMGERSAPVALIPCPLPVTATHHHFANDARTIAGSPALVTTRDQGSPLADALDHTVQVALTPAAAAALMSTLEGRRLPLEVAQLLDGLRGAAAHALDRS